MKKKKRKKRCLVGKQQCPPRKTSNDGEMEGQKGTTIWLMRLGMWRSHVQLFATLLTLVHQAPLSMKIFRQEYWSGLSFPTPEDRPNPGIKNCLMCFHLKKKNKTKPLLYYTDIYLTLNTNRMSIVLAINTCQCHGHLYISQAYFKVKLEPYGAPTFDIILFIVLCNKCLLRYTHMFTISFAHNSSYIHLKPSFYSHISLWSIVFRSPLVRDR